MVTLLLISFETEYSQFIRSTLNEKIDTTDLNYTSLATKITEHDSGNYNKAKTLLHWLTDRLKWMATDYKSRIIKEILARGGGNCFELAKVYMQLIQSLGIQYRPIAEINIYKYSVNRQATAEEKVRQHGNRMGVFGLQHNDHRWLEVFEDSSKTWQPVDPSMNVIGTDQWLKARVWFGNRITLDTAITKQILSPFAIFVVKDNKFEGVETRSEYYLADGFDKIYGNKPRSLPSWSKWVEYIK